MTAAENVSIWYVGSRGERKHSMTPREAWISVNPTCGASASLVNLYSSYI